jgi:hypothetical protein
MISAPSVNQIRFFSSSALANAPKFRFEASCSAADAMRSVLGLQIHGRDGLRPVKQSNGGQGFWPGRRSRVVM